MVKTRLIFPPSLVANGNMAGRMDWLDHLMGGNVPVDWEGTEYSKCGRTDRGVSAFGQVVALRVRSARPVVKMDAACESQTVDAASAEEGLQPADSHDTANALPVVESSDADAEPQKAFDPINDELPYITLLNKMLPPTIRVLAWCPNPPTNFSARYSCKERMYRYFFTNPAYLPAPGQAAAGTCSTGTSPKSGWLDIEAMQKAANLLVGSHDFRNFCKIDPSKQPHYLLA